MVDFEIGEDDAILVAKSLDTATELFSAAGLSLEQRLLAEIDRDALTPHVIREFVFILFKGRPAHILSPDRKGDRLIFPVSPEEIAMSESRTFGTYDVIQSKQKMRIGQPQLRTFSFSTFFPKVFDEDYCYSLHAGLDYQDPEEPVNWIWDHMHDPQSRPLSFGSIGDAVFPTMPVYVTGFTPSYKPGHPNDVFFDIEITEFDAPDIHLVRRGQKHHHGPRWLHKKWKTHRGDTLHEIAVHCYGKGYGALWKRIRTANPHVHAEHRPKKHHPGPHELLVPGQHLHIPAPTGRIK